MDNQESKLQILYNISLKIGTSLNLYEMLRTALAGYIRELDCITGIIYRLGANEKAGSDSEMIFSIPYALIGKSYIPQIERFIPSHFTDKELEVYRKRLPLKEVNRKNQFFTIMNLQDFGFLMLVKKDAFIEDDMIERLKVLNSKLSHACLDCVNNSGLEESEFRYRQQQELLPEMLCELDKEGVVTFANNYSLEKMGYTNQDILNGLSIFSLIHADQHEDLRKNLASSLNSDKLPPREYIAVKRDGTVFPSLVYTNRIVKNNRAEGLIGVMVDISGLKENEKKLEQNLRQQELLSEIALELNCVDNVEGRINSVLDKIGNHTGVSRVYIFEDSQDGLETSNTFEWCNAGIKPQRDQLQRLRYEAFPSWKGLLLTQGRVYFENISILPEDLKSFLEQLDIKSIVVYPVYVHEKYFGFIGYDECSHTKSWNRSELELLRAISGIIGNTFERKIMQKSILDERDRANDANRAKSEFLANMSHEIRTPMNAILGFSEALYHKLDSVQHRKMIESVLSSGNLLLSLLNDILDLSKIEAGKLDISLQPVDLLNILDEIKLLFDDKARKSGIKIYISASENFPSQLILDDIRIRQVIFNLVGNAVKFTHNGFVRIKVFFNQKNPESGELVLQVEDSGIGIPESQQELIFESFRQQSGQSNRVYGGIGLGLAISRKLVEKMNGVLSVSSKEGEGSIFVVTLPDVAVGASGPGKTGLSGFSDNIIFKNSSILVVDDVSSNVEALQNLLAVAGLNISSAENGEEALIILESLVPDIILVDIRLPGMSGYELAERIKSDPGLSGVPVIAFTASVFNTGKIESSGLFDALLLKPASRFDLLKLLSRFLEYEFAAVELTAGKEDQLNIATIEEPPEGTVQAIAGMLRDRLIRKFEIIRDQFILFRIEEFAEGLREISAIYDYVWLRQYSERIMHELEMVDLDSLRDTLNFFPAFYEKILRLSETS